MQLDYAFLAHNAGFLKDDKLVVYGCEVELISVPIMPIPGLPIAIVAKLLLAPDEPLDGHTYSVQFRKPNGELIPLAENHPLRTVRNAIFPDRPSGASVVVNAVIGIEAPGEYAFIVFADGRELKTLRFMIAVLPE
jgi:hypothetical protein